MVDNDTTPTLEARLADLGGELLMAQWAALACGQLVAVPQDEADASWAPPLTRDDGKLALGLPARQLHAAVRALQPWPGAIFATVLGEDWKVGAAGLSWDEQPAPQGVVAAIDRTRVWLGCGQGRLGITELQRPNKARAAAPDVLRGVRLGVGAQLARAPT